MSHAQKNKLSSASNKFSATYDNEVVTWQPSALLETLKKRAEILKVIRYFFANRSILEVETPLLCHTSVTDPFIESIPATFKKEAGQRIHHRQIYYLQTSPEYAMKRLLAAGSGPIYQISKAFRQGEKGRHHNPEFTMLEWYQPGFNHHDLMDEMDDLLQLVLVKKKADRYRYAEIFAKYLQINPHQATLAELQAVAAAEHIDVQNKHAIVDRDTWLQLLLAHCIEPHLGKDAPCFIYDFPATQAALSRIRFSATDHCDVASRFEVYYRGIELANGFHELQDANEQRKRFSANLDKRKELGLEPLPIDEYFLAALHSGLPDCAGVALGVDRLIMLATNNSSISDVLTFSFDRV